tara:strand:- start:2447 stop:3121 length:675 start_codon:yes stop_codon:yes gene_type:complete
MISKFNVLILARGGSKSIHKKNLIELDGKPIIYYPINSAKKSEYVNDVYVSTDDTEIKQVSLNFGAKVIDRPDEMAQDHSLDIDSMKHYVEYLDSWDDFVHLRATSPLVKIDVLNGAIQYFINNNDCTSLRSAHEMDFPPEKMFKRSGKYWKGVFDLKDTEMPRQQFEKTYKPNGHVDIVRPKYFMNYNSLHGDKILSYVTEYTHDIDTENDYKKLKVEFNEFV